MCCIEASACDIVGFSAPLAVIRRPRIRAPLVTPLPGARSKFGAPMFEPEVFRKQMCCIEASACDIVGTFRRPGECAPPRYPLPGRPREQVPNEKEVRTYATVIFSLKEAFTIFGVPAHFLTYIIFTTNRVSLVFMRVCATLINYGRCEQSSTDYKRQWIKALIGDVIGQNAPRRRSPNRQRTRDLSGGVETIP